MRNTKLLRYVVYLIFGGIILFVLNEILVAYSSIKADISLTELNNEIRTHNTILKHDSTFYTKINKLLAANNYDEVINMLKYRIKSAPTNKSVLLINIGDTYTFKNDMKAALKSYSAAIINDSGSTNVNSYVKRGEIYLKLNRLDDAIKDYKVAAAYNFDYYYFLGLLQERKGNFKQAKSSYDSCLIYYPKSKVCKLKLDSLNLKMGN